MSTISCSNVSKAYGGMTVIKDFNLDIEDHEFVVLLGPSGCGKSTLLRMLAGLEDISGGTVQIDKTTVNDLPPRDRGVAMVFQNYALYPHMSIFENIAFGLRRQHVPEAEIKARVASVAGVLGLEPYLDRKPNALSGGQQQRVAIARAMIKTPKVFLFDEPLSNLDAKLRHHMRVEIARLHKQLKTTTVYVTHDQLEAMTLADRIVLMRDGNIEQVGTPREIYDNPQTLFVAGFIGTPNMNMLKGTVQIVDGKAAFVAGKEAIALPEGRFTAQVGHNVVLGIRPGVVKLSGAEQSLKGNVTGVEFHGQDTLYTLNFEGETLTALVPSQEIYAESEVVGIELPGHALHLFDAESGQSLRV
jgi:multiple sugar transport system ATP-binding protein